MCKILASLDISWWNHQNSEHSIIHAVMEWNSNVQKCTSSAHCPIYCIIMTHFVMRVLLHWTSVKKKQPVSNANSWYVKTLHEEIGIKENLIPLWRKLFELLELLTPRKRTVKWMYTYIKKTQSANIGVQSYTNLQFQILFFIPFFKHFNLK